MPFPANMPSVLLREVNVKLNIPSKAAIAVRPPTNCPALMVDNVFSDPTNIATAPAMATRLAVFTPVVNAFRDSPTLFSIDEKLSARAVRPPPLVSFLSPPRKLSMNSLILSVTPLSCFATATILAAEIPANISSADTLSDIHVKAPPRVSLIIDAMLDKRSPTPCKPLPNPENQLTRFWITLPIPLATFSNIFPDLTASSIPVTKSAKPAIIPSKPSSNPPSPPDPIKAPIGDNKVIITCLTKSKALNKPLAIL